MVTTNNPTVNDDRALLADLAELNRSIDRVAREYRNDIRLLKRRRQELIQTINQIEHRPPGIGYIDPGDLSAMHLPGLQAELRQVDRQIADTERQRDRTLAKLAKRAAAVERRTLTAITPKLLRSSDNA